MSDSDLRSIELLTQDLDVDRPVAVKGPMVSEPLGAAMKWLDDDEPRERLAYRFKFFLRDKAGRPRPETLTPFFVRDYMVRDGSPTRLALDLAAQRIAARLGESDR